MDDDTQEACEAQQEQDERRREAEAIRHGQQVLRQFRAEQAAFNDDQTAWFHRMGWQR